MKNIASLAYKSVTQKAFLDPALLYIYFPFIKQIVKKTCTYMIKI